MFKVTPTTEEHADQLAETMRPEDVDECWATAHATPREALKSSMAGSRDTRTFLHGDEVICIFGVAQLFVLSDTGIPWMLGSKCMDKYWYLAARGSILWMEEQSRKWGTMVNYIDARNKKSIRWLKWMGFNIEPPVPYGPDDMPFHRFSWSAG